MLVLYERIYNVKRYKIMYYRNKISCYKTYIT